MFQLPVIGLIKQRDATPVLLLLTPPPRPVLFADVFYKLYFVVFVIDTLTFLADHLQHAHQQNIPCLREHTYLALLIWDL